MNYKIALNMKFWDDGNPESTRIRNVNFTWKKLKELTEFLKKNNVLADCFLYDFSPVKMISDSIHIPYPLGVYKKAEKTNLILKQQTDYDFFMMFDCDAFFHEDDYNNILEIIKNINVGDVITFDLAKLETDISKYIIEDKFIPSYADWSYAYSGDKNNKPLDGRIGGLGGVYICDLKILLGLNGFNEEYVGWGGEDGDMLDRIMTSGKPHKILPTRDFAPFHLPHFSDWGNINYSKRFKE